MHPSMGTNGEHDTTQYNQVATVITPNHTYQQPITTKYNFKDNHKTTIKQLKYNQQPTKKDSLESRYCHF